MRQQHTTRTRREAAHAHEPAHDMTCRLDVRSEAQQRCHVCCCISSHRIASHRIPWYGTAPTRVCVVRASPLCCYTYMHIDTRHVEAHVWMCLSCHVRAVMSCDVV